MVNLKQESKIFRPRAKRESAGATFKLSQSTYMTTVAIDKEVTVKIVEQVNLHAPSFWTDGFSHFHLREDGTVITVMKRLLSIGDVSDRHFQSNLSDLKECKKEEFLSVLKTTQRDILQFTSNL